MAVPKLTFTYAQMFLTITVYVCCVSPSITIDSKETSHFPSRSISDQWRSYSSVITFIPANNDTNCVIYTKDTKIDIQITLKGYSDLDESMILRIHFRHQILKVEFFALDDVLIDNFQVTDKVSLQTVDKIDPWSRLTHNSWPRHSSCGQSSNRWDIQRNAYDWVQWQTIVQTRPRPSWQQ